jgi:hypothetical protein
MNSVPSRIHSCIRFWLSKTIFFQRTRTFHKIAVVRKKPILDTKPRIMWNTAEYSLVSHGLQDCEALLMS